MRGRLPARPPAPRERELEASPASDWNALRRRAARSGRLSDNSVPVAARPTAGFEGQPPPERPLVPTSSPLPPRRDPSLQSLCPREMSRPKLPPAPTGHPGHRAPRSRSPAGVQRARVHGFLQGPPAWLRGAANSGLSGSPTSLPFHCSFFYPEVYNESLM